MEEDMLKADLGERLFAQVDFLVQTDALKLVERKNLLHSGARRENAAEHSWHLSVLALVFAEHAPPEVNIAHVSQLLAVHDLVEVFAGDHWALDADALAVAQKEKDAAQDLFGRLPDDQSAKMHGLWKEFEVCETVDAKFAKALDALHPMLLVWGPKGLGKTHVPLNAKQMRELKRDHLQDFPSLWTLANALLDQAVRDGTLPED
jgi:putative hydrolase of HD superfamily